MENAYVLSRLLMGEDAMFYVNEEENKTSSVYLINNTELVGCRMTNIDERIKTYPLQN